jgi:hypothetical protein
VSTTGVAVLEVNNIEPTIKQTMQRNGLMNIPWKSSLVDEEIG